MEDQPDKFPEQMSDAAGPDQQAPSWWRYACDTARWLREGHPPPVTEVFGPLLKENEHGRLTASLLYSRLYGRNAPYNRSSFFALGSIPFMVGAYGVNALVNQSRQRAAEQQGAVQWRVTQTVSVVVTSERLLCCTVGGWLSFWFSAVTDFFPDLDNWALTLGFGGQTPALQLSGPASPAVALWIGHAVLGPRWLDDPRLSRLQ